MGLFATSSLQRVIFLVTLFKISQSIADFGNYNTFILGDRASGMGGASVAVPGDSSSASFYNPALISQVRGNNFSGSASIYNKYDTAYAGGRASVRSPEVDRPWRDGGLPTRKTLLPSVDQGNLATVRRGVSKGRGS